MKGIRIYIEGGGDSSKQKKPLRLGFQQFLNPSNDRRLKIIVCGSRQDAFEDFRMALESHPDSVNLLLVDAEGPVSSASPWRHLIDQRDGFSDPGVGDDCCHLMVQLVEAWIVADPEWLQEFYGEGFASKSLPPALNVEAIPKDDLLKGLKRATTHTKKGEYQKIKHCADLLKGLSSERVKSRAHHCKRLFAMLERFLAQAANG